MIHKSQSIPQYTGKEWEVQPLEKTSFEKAVQRASNTSDHSVKFKSELILGDVIDVLSTLNNKQKFDVIIADPPYNIGKDFGNGTGKKSIPEYVKWCNEWLQLCFQRLSDDGIIYIYGFPEILARVSVMYPIDKQRWLVWHYTNKTVPSSKFWQRSHESILCLWHSENIPDLQIEQIREPYTEGYKSAIGRTRAGTKSRFGNGKETVYSDNGGALPRDVIKIPALAGGAGARERWFMCYENDRQVLPPSQIKKYRDSQIMKHPTQKPMELTRRLIQSRIKGSSGRVLIPFAGSGSECVVANELGIEWLGIEINAEYVEFAQKWIDQYTG
ncbi:MAG: site-specific DNA-methyltransferase [Bacteroidetes bacterium]|nr:site-specific DNA-methyltransferase [Bacteroidota bacterium]MCY4233345.1 site-specific DNA-methyltransferase [Bacteroidota bacterium]